MSATQATADGQIQELSVEEGRALFDRNARRLLNMSGDEFIRRYEAGEWPDPDADERIIGLVMLLPFAR